MPNTASLLTVSQIADKTGLSVRTVYNRLRSAHIKGRKVGGRWYITAAELDTVFEGRSSAESPISSGLESIEDQLRQLRLSFSAIEPLIAQAGDSGVTAIYSQRRESSRTTAAITSLLQKARHEIQLMGISLRQFFHDQPLKEVLWNRVTQTPVQVRALLLDPLSEAAMARVVVEEGIDARREKCDSAKPFARSPVFKSSVLVKNLEASIAGISRLRGLLKTPEQLDARFYSCTPFAFVVMTEDAMIIEQYHFGRNSSAVGGCAGELVPLLQVRADCAYYRMLKSSFDHLWNAGKENPFVAVRTLADMENTIQEFARA